MRKLSTAFLLLLVGQVFVWAKPVSPREAEQTAVTFLQSLPAERSGLKSASAVELELVYTAGRDDAAVRTKTASDGGSYYVFNRGGNAGFVIVSGDDRARAVLGYSLTGTFRADDMPVQLKTWLGHYEAEIKMLADRPEGQASPYSVRAGEHDGVSPVVEPLLGGIKWGQDVPFNNMCPIDPNYDMKSPAGCVATAMVQIMKYHEWPKQGKGSKEYRWETGGVTLSADFGATTYEWDKMLDDYAAVEATEEQMAAAALITYHAGIGVEMDYNVEGSGATAQNTAIALRDYFDYDKNLEYIDRTHYDEAEWTALLKQELDNARPVLYLGEGDGGGHAFVCDGYDSRDYFHINWGWNGLSDGYYQVSALDPDVLGTGGGSGAYNYLQSVFTNMQPPTESSTHVAGIHMSKALECQDEAIGRNGSTTVNIGMYNYGLRAFTGQLGLALYGEDGGLTATAFTREVENLREMVGGSKNNSFKSVTVPAEVPEGLYRMYAVHKEAGTDTWVKMQAPVNLPDYMLVTVEADSVRFDLPRHASKVTVEEKPKLVSKLYAGAKATFELTVKNEGKEFYSYIGVRLFKVGDPSVNQFVTAKIVRVPEGATRTFSFRSDEVIRLEPGMYEAVAVYDSTNMQKTYLYSMLPEENMLSVVEVLENPDPAKLHLISKVSVRASDGSDNIYERGEAVVTCRLKNAGGYVDATLTAFVLHATDDEVASLDSFNPQEVSIDGGGNIDLTFTKNLALAPGEYRMAMAYLGDDDYWRLLSPFNPVHFEIKERPSALDSTDAGNGITFFADGSGLHITSTEELRAVRLFDLSGKAQGEWMPGGFTADIPLDGQAAGMYLCAVQTADGSKTFKFIKR